MVLMMFKYLAGDSRTENKNATERSLDKSDFYLVTAGYKTSKGQFLKAYIKHNTFRIIMCVESI